MEPGPSKCPASILIFFFLGKLLILLKYQGEGVSKRNCNCPAAETEVAVTCFTVLKMIEYLLLSHCAHFNLSLGRFYDFSQF